MLASLFLMGTGNGLYLALLGLLACLAGSSRATIGVFCLLFGVPVLGYVANTVGYFGWGGDVIVVIGLLLLVSKLTLHTAILKSPVGLFFVAWSVLVVLFFFFIGPQTSYSWAMLIGYLKAVFLTFISFLVLFSDKSVNWTQLGLLGILSALILLGAAGRVDPGILPSSIFDVGSVRLLKKITETGLFTHQLGYLAILGFMFIYSKDVSQPRSVKNLIILAIALFVTVVLIGWSGARQGLFILLIGSGSIFLCKFEGKYKRYFVPAMAVGLLLFVTLFIGFARNPEIYGVLFDSEKSFTEKINRAGSFNTAFSLIAEDPLLGQGIGGYRFGDLLAGDEQHFAHNVLLDLLVQTGLIGTAVFFVPLILIPNYRKRFGRMRSEILGNVVLPVFVVMFLRLMVDSQLNGLGVFVGVIAAMDLVRQDGSRRAADITTARSTKKIPADNTDKWPYTRKRAF